MKKLSNLKISDVRYALEKLGLEKQRVKGGHEMWAKKGMTRPVVLQSHVEPVPEFVVKNIIRILGITKENFLSVVEK